MSRIERALSGVPEILRADVSDWLQSVSDAAGKNALDDLPLQSIARLIASSPFAADVLRRQWSSLASNPGNGFDRAQAAKTLQRSLAPDAPRSAALRALRDMRNASLVRILWQDYVDRVPVESTLADLSALAETCLDAACAFAHHELVARYGLPEENGVAQPLVVLAMGKLGGRELNFSSDIDLIFLHPENGETTGPKSTSAHEFFARLTRRVIALLEEPTSDGFVYRVDTRLRPYGNSGPPVVSFSALEAYLLEHGRGWERYAYVKARPVTRTAHSAAAKRLVAEIVTPFVYRRYLDYGVFESLRDMQAMIAAEVEKRELYDNVKLGPGGIREIEFFVQSLQLVRGGATHALQTPGLRSAIAVATNDRDLDEETANRLLRAYDFLRRVENAIQACRDQQTHSLPVSELERARLAFALRFAGWAELSAELDRTREWVAEQFDAIGKRDQPGRAGDSSVSPVAALWTSAAPPAEWLDCLAGLGLQPVVRGEIADALSSLAGSSAVARLDSVAAERLQRFIEGLLPVLASSPRPIIALRRILDVADSILRRSAYLALLNENPTVLRRLVDLCATSAVLAREITEHPVLLDELIDARIFIAAPTDTAIETDLDVRLSRVDAEDPEAVIEALAVFKRVTLFRLAVADFSGAIPIMQVSDRLTGLAELILRRALDLARADVVRQFGQPRYRLDGANRTADIGIISYGKLAGYELAYASDLDLVFLHDSRGDAQTTDGDRSIDNQVFFSRLARRLLHFLTTRTPAGVLYDIDTRLRPSGRSGLLVTSIDAFRRYQEQDAWTWEHQALLRSRPVAGSPVVAEAFAEIRESVLRHPSSPESLRDDVLNMRAKMRAQLDRSDEQNFDLKQGEGGIADIEFLVQYLALRHAPEHLDVIEYTDNIRQLDALQSIGRFPRDRVERLQNIYKAYRGMAHRLSLDEQPALAAAGTFVAEREFVIDTWRDTFDLSPG
ncbi:MAG: bifunctional [glutamate--ammonia ligase]-adenylyl-L-tyrosine phosphorylase/[glutamate--ammonia-ligase] adenylyltransferase [Pseudomonadota bacterium]